jgi:hypothetical protein
MESTKLKVKAVALLINGESKVIDFDDTALATIIQGYFQAVPLNDETVMWLSEEGKLDGLPHNKLGQLVWNEAYGAGTDYIVGNVIITGGADGEGGTLPLLEETAQRILKITSPS